MSRVKDEVGNTYGNLTVTSRKGSIRGFAAWECKCVPVVVVA